MSLSKIGNLKNAFKMKSTSGVASALAAFGDVSTAGRWLGQINIGKDGRGIMTQEKMIQLLKSKYGDASEEEILQALNIGATNATTGTAAISSGSSILSSLKSTGAGLVAALKPLLPVFGGIAAIFAGYKAIKWADDKFTLSDTAADKHYSNSKEKYQETVSDYQSLKNQYDQNKEQIYELRAKENPTLEERQQLSTLEQENKLLGTQVTTKEKLADVQQKQLAADAKTKLDKRVATKEDVQEATKNNTFVPEKTDIERTSEYIDQLKQLEASRDSLAQQHILDTPESTLFGTSDYEKNEKALSDYDTQISNLKQKISDNISDIQETAMDIYDEQGNLIDQGASGTAKQVDDLLDKYFDEFDSVDSLNEKINNVFAKSQFKDAQKILENAGKTGGSKGVSAAIKKIAGLSDELNADNIDEESLVDYIMSIAAPDAKNMESIKNELRDKFAQNDLAYFFSGKSDDELKNFYNYYKNNGYDAQKYNWDYQTLLDNWTEAQKSAKEIKAESPSFSSLFKNSAEDTATDLDTITDNFQTDMSNIKSAMDSIKTGTFQNSDVTDLIQQFPELATETDNLQQGLQKLTFDKANKAIGEIRDSVKDVTDPKELAAADRYVQSIMDTMDLSSMSMKDMKSQIRSNVASNAENEHMVPQVLENLLGQYGNDEYAVQAILKLSVDPNFVNDSVEDQISKIEDTKVQVHIDVDTDKLDTLSKSLTRLQTEASQMQTDMNDKATLNQKVTAQDYTDLINNGKKQISNLNQQIAVNEDLQTTVAKGSEQYKQYQDQIDAAQSSIKAIEVSQVEWAKTSFNLPVTDMQNTVSALTTAISEMQTETGLTSDTMDSLRTQFSDLKKANVDTIFERTAKGLKVNTDRMKDYLEQQNDFMNSDFANRIKNYQNELSKGTNGYTDAGLEQLRNLQAQYYAQYQEAAKQFSNFQAMVNADNTATEGDEYTKAKSYLENAKDLYDKGLVGTPQFKAAAKYFSQNGFEDAGNFIENYDKLKNYYTDDASGPKRFLNDLQAKGLATYETLEDGSQKWAYSFTDVQDAADSMGMSLESFQSMFGRLSDYGFDNNSVTSLEEGTLKTEELNDKLVEAQTQMAKLKARGASQTALDDQQAVIDHLISQQQDVSQAITDYTTGAAGRKLQDVKEAKSVIDDLSAEVEKVGKDSDLGKAYIDQIQQYADKAGITLTPEFKVDESAYNDLVTEYENKAKGAKIKHYQDVNTGIENGDTGGYTDSDVELVNKIKESQDKKSEDYQQLQDLVNTLNQQKPADLDQIELGNGAYESEDQGIRAAEDALQSYADQLGLTKEQANALLPALQALGLVNIDPNVDTSGIDELDASSQEAMSNLREMQANKEIHLSFDIDSNTDGLTVEQLDSQIKELENAKIDVKAKFGIDSSEYQQVQSMIDQRELQMHVQIALDKNVDVDNLLKLTDQELAEKAELNVDVNTDEGKTKIDELRSSLESLSSETADLTVKIDESQFSELTKSLTTDTVDLTVDVHDEQLSALESKLDSITSQERKVTVNADAPDTSQVTALSDAINQVLPRTVGVKADVKGTDDVNDLISAITRVLPKTVRVGADVFGTDAVNALVSAISSVHDKTATVTVTTNHITNNITNNSSGPVPTYTGTALSPAHASGTAYNVLNTIPISSAFANGGKVGLSENQEALVNELGTESVIRGDKWFLLPGGMHTENLKKGDIVLNHKQTADLIKGGKAFGHARAYANGNLDDLSVLNAYGNGALNGGGSFQGGAASVKPAGSGNSGTSANTKAINNNTKAVNNASKSTSDTSDKVSTELENAIKKLKDNAMDWIEVAMDRLDRITSKYVDTAENGFPNYTKTQSLYDKAIKSTDKEIKAAEQAVKKYKTYAETVANNPQVKKYLTPSLKKKVQDGTINIESLSANQKAAVEAYKEYYDKYLDATQTYREKKVQKLEYAKAKVDATYEKYDSIAEKYSARQSYYQAVRDNRVARGLSQYVELGDESKSSVWYKQFEKEASANRTEISKRKQELKEVQKNMRNYLKTKGASTSDQVYQDMLAEETKLKTTIVELDTNLQNLSKSMQEAREQLLQWKTDRWERAGAKQDASINYRLATDNPYFQIQEKDYTERIKSDERQIIALQKLRQEKAEYYDSFITFNNEEAQKYLDEIAQIDEQIMNLGTSMEELKNKIMELRWKPFDDLQNDLSNVVTEYQNMQKLLGSEDSFYNDDGSFTTNGLTNILLTQESIDATKQKIANYREGLNKLDEQYKNGCYSAEEYKTKQQELLKGLQQESAAFADLKQNMLDMYTTQITKENDLLQENIEKRKDALSAKEKYYDYDKTLKKKTKDINTLKAQIAALEGASSAASKARLEKLRAELADAEDDMADTMHQHEVDMKNTGYENFSDEANKALDNTLDAVKKNSDFQEAIIGGMLSNVTANYDSTYNHLRDVMDQYGVKVSSTFDKLITKSADFNTSLASQVKAMQEVINMATNLPSGVSNGQGGLNGTADKTIQNTANTNQSSNGAGNQTDLDNTTYKLTLSQHSVYLLDKGDGKRDSVTLKATWSPKTPNNPTITWTSSNTVIATVNQSGKVTAASDTKGNNIGKTVITASGIGGSDKCDVYVMPYSNYVSMRETANSKGLTLSDDKIRAGLEYSYKNGKGNTPQQASIGFMRSYLQDWFNALPDRPEGTTNIPEGKSGLATYFMKQGKNVTRYTLQNLADILGIKTPGADNYESWDSSLKNKILKAYKSYGFSKGGVVRSGIPASILDMIGADALIPRGDSVLIGANPGETVLTKEFTDQLKPTVATLNAFNEMMAKPIAPVLPSSNDNSVNMEYNFTFNNPVMKSEEDVESLIKKALSKNLNDMKRDARKFR